ncbi:MAG: hypothetical protein JXA42_03190 [Anaerolineales bacterium]|nr:hypothetical protein [Anaerolineales bacterium]
MPGIFGIAQANSDKRSLTMLKDHIETLLNTHREKSLFLKDVLVSPPFLLGFHSICKLDTHKGVIRSDSVAMAFDGVLFEPWPTQGLAEILSQYEKNSAALLDSIRGIFSFSVCNYTTGDIAVYTDQAGTRPVYYAIQDNVFYFAGDYSVLSAILPDPGEIDTQAVYDMLTFGYLTGNKTPSKKIKCAPPGSCLTWNVNTAKLNITSYFTAYSSLELTDYSQITKQLEQLFIQAVERSLRAGRPLFTISGGLDSRAVLATALMLGYDRPECLSFGELASLDIKLALQVAEKTNAELALISLGNGDYLTDTLTRASLFNGGMVYYSGSAHMLYALSKLDAGKWDIVQTGMSGDMLMGSFLHKDDITKLANDTTLITNRVIKQLGQLNWIERLALDDFSEDPVFQSVSNSIIEPKPDTTISQAVERWNLENRQQRGMFNGFRMIEHFSEYSSPFFDADLYKFTLSIPHRYRLGEKIYLDMLSRLLPASLWGIPWQKTGHPPSTKNWINTINAKATMGIGRAKQLISPQTERKRSMNPINAWLRDNVRLRQFAIQQLSCWDSIPYPLDKKRVQDFYLDIEKGQIGKSQRLPTILFRLLTLSTWGNT